jgi:hypothetical protein
MTSNTSPGILYIRLPASGDVFRQTCIMSKFIVFLALLPLSAFCQTKGVRSAAVRALTSEASPMSCHIAGKVVEVLKPKPADKGSICVKYPCRAKVRIMDISVCGPAVSLSANAGDTVVMRFTYTLHATAKLFPRMKMRYPGLKKGDVFTANAVQHLEPGSEGGFVITDYHRK